jgi:hypothetical protein
MAARTDPNLTDKLAAMIVLYLDIPRDVAKGMSNKQIVALLNWDHDPVPVAIAVSLGWGPEQYNHATNLTGRIPEDHDFKTAKKDVPAIAKADRISDAHVAFQRRVLAKSGQGDAPAKPKSKWKSRPFRSRGFEKRR